MAAIFQYVPFIPLLPCLGFLITILLNNKIPKMTSGLITTSTVFISAILSWLVAFEYFFISGKINGMYNSIIVANVTWLKISENFTVELGAILDPVSATMLVVVTTVSAMVFLFSLGYMKNENGFTRYFAFLSLFVFSMLSLVLSTNIIQIYVFWELVGASSFLLIGFFYDKPSAVAASKKAFIVTRFADLFLLVGILFLSFYTETLSINEIINKLTTSTIEQQAMISASFIGLSAITWSLLLIFIGCAGKSAMLPLHIWLPDAMEGPTPVSALIHAATMVVAGVFLIARLFPVYAVNAPVVLDVIAYVGSITALFAALIACTQYDIKRVLAYSTISQIGYMLFSLGVARFGEKEIGFTASMFHLFTHAFFKALLFLCSGVIIHSVHSNDMRQMGGLWKKMPVTHLAFLIACLSISGVPLFSGFFSKEHILTSAYMHNQVVYFLGLLTACITGFYMFRLYFRIFHYEDSLIHQPQKYKSSPTMIIPLIILMLITLASGWIPFSEYVSASKKSFSLHFHLSTTIAAIIASFTGIALALKYFKKTSSTNWLSPFSNSRIYSIVYNKFYVDEIYFFITKKILFSLVAKPVAWIDRNVVDAAINGTANATTYFSNDIKIMQNGNLQSYLLYFLTGIILLISLFIYLWNY